MSARIESEMIDDQALALLKLTAWEKLAIREAAHQKAANRGRSPIGALARLAPVLREEIEHGDPIAGEHLIEAIIGAIPEDEKPKLVDDIHRLLGMG